MIIFDDPHNIKDADNCDVLNSTIKRCEPVLFSRFNNPKVGRAIVIGQRVADNDLSSHLLRQGNWTHVCLELIAHEAATYPTRYGPWRRHRGDLLRPEAFDTDYIEQLKSTPSFRLLYQQGLAITTASPEITADCFGFHGGGVPLAPLVMSIDCGVTNGSKNSYSVIQIWCPYDEKYLLVDQWRAQCDFATLNRNFRRLAARFQPTKILIEKGANGPALVSMMSPVQRARTVEIVPRESKVERLLRNIDTILERRILLPPTGMHHDYIAEFILIGRGEFTDQVDATTQFLDFMAGNPQLAPLAPRMVGIVASRGQPGPGQLGSGGPTGDTPCRPGSITNNIGSVSGRGR